MVADADPSFEVATIKPALRDELHPIFNLRAHEFHANGTSAKELIMIAYNIRGRQVLGGPPWLEDDERGSALVPPPTMPVSNWSPRKSLCRWSSSITSICPHRTDGRQGPNPPFRLRQVDPCVSGLSSSFVSDSILWPVEPNL